MMCTQCWARGQHPTSSCCSGAGGWDVSVRDGHPQKALSLCKCPSGLPACLACCVAARCAPSLQPLWGLDKLLKGRARSEPSWASPLEASVD